MKKHAKIIVKHYNNDILYTLKGTTDFFTSTTFKGMDTFPVWKDGKMDLKDSHLTGTGKFVLGELQKLREIVQISFTKKILAVRISSEIHVWEGVWDCINICVIDVLTETIRAKEVEVHYKLIPGQKKCVFPLPTELITSFMQLS